MASTSNEILQLISHLYETKVQELKNCYDATERKLEEDLLDLRIQVQKLDDHLDDFAAQEKRGKQKDKNLQSIKEIWKKRHKEYIQLQHSLEAERENAENQFQEMCKAAKQQLQVQMSAPCSKDIPTVSCDLPNFDSDAKKAAPTDHATSSEMKTQLKKENKLLLDKLVQVRTYLEPSDSNQGDDLTKKHADLESELRELEQENLIIQDIIQRKTKRISPSSAHLEELENILINILSKA